MNTTQEQNYIAEARERGRRDAIAAASWATDGNTTREHAQRVLAMLDNGDPESEVYLPRRPDLSGEWADDPTPRSLARDITGDPDPDFSWTDVLADAYEEGVSDAFEAECERRFRLVAESGS